MENKPTRAQRMAEQYGKKLEEISGVKIKIKQKNDVEVESEEMREKRKLALAKLATFKDM